MNVELGDGVSGRYMLMSIRQCSITDLAVYLIESVLDPSLTLNSFFASRLDYDRLG